MPDKRREDVPEIPEDASEARGGGIDIPVPEEAPARGRSRRGRKRAASPETEPDLLPESAAPAETVYTLGSQNEFGDVEDVPFEDASDGAAETPAPKESTALDISDIPNAVPAPDAPKPAGNSRRRKKRRSAQARSAAAASVKASASDRDTAEDDTFSAPEPRPAAERPGVPEEPSDVKASESADRAPSGADEASATDAAAPKTARSKRRGKRRPAQPEQPDGGNASSEADSARASDDEVAAPRDAVSAPDAEPSATAKKPEKESRRPAAQAVDASGDADEAADAASETPAGPPRTPKPKAPAAALLRRGILTENPLLFGLVGVFPAVAAASTGLTALAAGICALAALLVTNLAASLIGDRLPRRLRAALLLLLAACVSSGEQLALAALLPDTADALGVFIPLVAVCGLTLSRESFAADHRPVSALLDAAACGAGFAAALTLFGVIREVLGSRTLFGLDIPIPTLPPLLAFAAPMGGLLLLGLLSGAARYVRTKRRASKRGSKEAEL